MLRRLFLLLTGLWALACLWGGANRGDGSGIEQKDVVLAFAPMAFGWFVSYAARFVITGSVRKQPRRPVVYRR